MASPWGAPYGFEDDEEVDNERADDEDFNADEEAEGEEEEDEEEAEGEDEDEEAEYQDDSDDSDDDDDELDEDEQDAEDARQLRAVVEGAPLQAAPTAATAGVKRRRDEPAAPDAAAQPKRHAPSPQRAANPGVEGGKQRNVVKINLRQQTVQPKYTELSGDEAADSPAGQPRQQHTAWQPAPVLQQQRAPQQAWQQPAVAQQPAWEAQPAAAEPAWQQPAVAQQQAWQVQAAAAQPAWQQQLVAAPVAPPAQQFAVPDWAAHLPATMPAATPQPQQLPPRSAAGTPPPALRQSPAPKPWERPLHKAASGSALASKQSSGGSKAGQYNYKSSPGFYAESDGEEEQDSRAKRMRKIPHVLLPEDELALLGDEVEKLAGFKRILNYIKKVEQEEQRRPWLSREECELLDVQKEMEEEIVEQYKQIERIIGTREFSDGTGECGVTGTARRGGRKDTGQVKYLCKWRGLPYCDATYETGLDLQRFGLASHMVEFEERERRIQESHKTVDAQRRAFAASGSRAFTSQPDFLKGGTLRDYQLDGLNWMVYSWSRDCNGILADEMGLGKTVQCASMVGYLSEVQQIAGPFLVVVPLSTVPNWIREFRKWIPSVNAIVYVGDAQSREVRWTPGLFGRSGFEQPAGRTVPWLASGWVGVEAQLQAGWLGRQQKTSSSVAAELIDSVPIGAFFRCRHHLTAVGQAAASLRLEAPQVLRAFEWETGLATGRQYKFDVLITTYEMVIKDREMLRPIKWAYMMVDEAHRLKNDESALYKELIQWSFKSKLLVTGTPLQNNMRELWALLHFLHPDKFPSSAAFEAEYNMQDPEQVAKLHVTLRPHLLRRIIKDVEKSLPPKNERILRVGMTPLQRQYYKWILSRNFKELNKGARSQLSLLNILTELKKCCNHPFLFQSAEEEYRLRGGGDDDVATRLVVTSGKMVLLDKLLRRLFDTKHRVLIFSQMVRVLDIISDYLRLRGFQHQRLDGSTPAQQRHQAMEHFNAPGSADFAFLLSTRAGGLGINLATADTVIIFDSDWNPQNDLQAMSRAHRIGQKDTVNIYRFVTSGSVEEDILERAKAKMVLDHLVIQEEMAAILRFGAEELFREGEDVAEQAGQAVMEEELDAILARAEVVQDTGLPQGTGRMGDLLGQFNVATFKTNEDDAAFWNRLIPEDQRPKEQPEVIDTGGVRSSRLRQLDAEQLAAAVEDELPGGAGGAEYAVGGGKKKGGGGGGGGGGSKKRGQEPGAPVEGALLRIDVWPEEVDEQGVLVAPRGGPRPPDFPHTLARKDAAAFFKAAKQRGVISKLDLICKDTGGAVEAASEKARLALWFGLSRACEEALALLKGQQPAQQQQQQAAAAAAGGTSAAAAAAAATPALSGGPPAPSPATSGGTAGGFTGLEVSSGTPGGGAGAGAGSAKGAKQAEAKMDWFGIEVRAQETLDILRHWRLVESKIAELPEPLAATLALTNQQCPPLAQWMRNAEWGPREDTALLLGCWRHGIGAWERMSQDPDLAWLAPKLALAVADQIKGSGKDRETKERHALAMARILQPEKLPKASYLETRAYGILRQIEKVHLKPDRGATGGGGGGGTKTRAASRPPLPPGGTAGARGPGGGSRITPGEARSKHAAAHAAAGQSSLDEQDASYQAAEEMLGADTLVVVRKIRTLQRKGKEMDPKMVATKTRKYLHTIGTRIAAASEDDLELRHSLWGFVSHYSENQCSAEELETQFDLQLQEEGSEQGQEAADEKPPALAVQPGVQPAAAPVAQQAQQEQHQQPALPLTQPAHASAEQQQPTAPSPAVAAKQEQQVQPQLPAATQAPAQQPALSMPQAMSGQDQMLAAPVPAPAAAGWAPAPALDLDALPAALQAAAQLLSAAGLAPQLGGAPQQAPAFGALQAGHAEQQAAVVQAALAQALQGFQPPAAAAAVPPATSQLQVQPPQGLGGFPAAAAAVATSEPPAGAPALLLQQAALELLAGSVGAAQGPQAAAGQPAAQLPFGGGQAGQP
ncbi:Protein CHROMATIN REMODELING 5 [Chlorella vulgaris]